VRERSMDGNKINSGNEIEYVIPQEELQELNKEINAVGIS
jgi:hypothetical protein